MQLERQRNHGAYQGVGDITRVPRYTNTYPRLRRVGACLEWAAVPMGRRYVRFCLPEVGHSDPQDRSDQGHAHAERRVVADSRLVSDRQRPERTRHLPVVESDTHRVKQVEVGTHPRKHQHDHHGIGEQAA